VFDKRTILPSSGRVILTYGRSLMALVIARSLAQRGVEVIGCDDVDLTVLSFSKHVQECFTVAPWKTKPDQFLDDLQAAILEYAPLDERPYVLMPVFSEAELIARNRTRFEPTIKVAAPSWRSINLVQPKDHLARLVSAKGLPAPRSWVIETKKQLSQVAPTLTYPLIVKPSLGEGGRGVSLAASAPEAMARVLDLGLHARPLLQEVAPGHDYCVAVLANKGRLSAMMAYRNITTFPRKAGAGAMRETVDAEPFQSATEQLLQATGWTGLAELDFRWTGDATVPPQLIEVNPRFWAGIFHSIQTAVDFPWFLYLQTIGQPLDRLGEPNIGARTKTTGVWLLAALEEIAASLPRQAAAGQVWQQIRAQLTAGQWADLREQLGKATGVQSLGDIVAALRKAIADARGAPSELSETDDPLVGLGALFVLSSLIKHRRLPDELTYEAPRDLPPPVVKPAQARPVIGITMPNRGDTLHWMALKLAITLAGGRAIKLTAKAPRDPRSIDGLIFAGGSDVYPKTYEAQPKPSYRYDLARGDMEASWAVAALRHDIPVLGICRGAQMLNVLAGGTLHADLSQFADVDLRPSPWRKLTRREVVVVRPNSNFGELIGAGRLVVNLIHQQAIDRLGVGLTVAARQKNGVIQAIEDHARAYWIGVQFHPELMIYRAAHRRLFAALVAAAGRRRTQRGRS
jgi:gamma-glutamyl-gamma-aminobutyrate hydrolase PuuD/predicted ATP-grasp superfamily ATP-dependent carboligase